jgi:hypothetical protein
MNIAPYAFYYLTVIINGNNRFYIFRPKSIFHQQSMYKNGTAAKVADHLGKMNNCIQTTGARRTQSVSTRVNHSKLALIFFT